MLPSPSSSPRSVLGDASNVPLVERTPTKKFWFIPSTPSSRRLPIKRPAGSLCEAHSNKRLKLDDSDQEDAERLTLRPCRRRQLAAVFGQRSQCFDTTSVLASFVSSHRSDVIKCNSADSQFLTPPYACSYTQGAKTGKKPLLAVATEQGSIQLFDTTKRQDWETNLPESTIDAHHNGVFDIKWNAADTHLATCSGDKSVRISCATSSQTLYCLRGHSGTPKSVAWHPSHPDLLSSGGRDGAICIWDLRMASCGNEEGMSQLAPVMTIPDTHEDYTLSSGKTKTRGKSAGGCSRRSVTSVVYNELSPHELISSGSSDGVLRCWDMRYVDNAKAPKTIRPFRHSDFDPTLRSGSKRPRGIISLTPGSGPTSGLLFGLATDSRIYTYAAPSLTPLMPSYMHPRMRADSFDLSIALSPCGRWLASGSVSPSGSCFLFDVSNAGRPFASASKGIELPGGAGEVGTMDWAEDVLATCVSDGVVRMWRPDIDIYRECLEDSEAKKWNWTWATAE